MEVVEGPMPGAAEGGEAALDEDEAVGHFDVAVGEGSGFVEIVSEPFAAIVDGVVPELGFEGGGAAGEPVAADELEDEGGFAGALGVAVVEVLALESFEVGGALVVDDDGLSVEAVAESVLGGGGLAGSGAGAGGALRIAAIRVDLGLSGHGLGYSTTTGRS